MDIENRRYEELAKELKDWKDNDEKKPWSWRNKYAGKNKYTLMTLNEMNNKREEIIGDIKKLCEKECNYLFIEDEIQKLMELEREIEKLGFMKKEDRVFKRNWKEKLNIRA